MHFCVVALSISPNYHPPLPRLHLSVTFQAAFARTAKEWTAQHARKDAGPSEKVLRLMEMGFAQASRSSPFPLVIREACLEGALGKAGIVSA